MERYKSSMTRPSAVRSPCGGAFRFDSEFSDALSLLASGLKVEPVISHIPPLSCPVEAFELAGDRGVASKVLLDLDSE